MWGIIRGRPERLLRPRWTSRAPWLYPSQVGPGARAPRFTWPMQNKHMHCTGTVSFKVLVLLLSSCRHRAARVPSAQLLPLSPSIRLIAHTLCFDDPQEGFQPAAFRSSRGARQGAVSQSVEDFLDEDELEERGRAVLTVKVRHGGPACSLPPCGIRGD